MSDGTDGCVTCGTNYDYIDQLEEIAKAAKKLVADFDLPTLKGRGLNAFQNLGANLVELEEKLKPIN